jgi:hypothetical protein
MFLKTMDLARLRTSLIRLVQAHAFPNEIALLKAGRALPNGNRLVKLNPFVDVNSGILYVGVVYYIRSYRSSIDIHPFFLKTLLIVAFW